MRPIKFRNSSKVLPLLYGSLYDTLVRALQQQEDLSYIVLDKVKLKGASFRNARFPHGSFKDAKINWTSFVGADLRYADFSNADLRGCHFLGADLSHAKFINADLRYTGLSSTICNYANFTGAKVAEATVVGAILDKAKGAQELVKLLKKYDTPDLEASIKDLVGHRNV